MASSRSLELFSIFALAGVVFSASECLNQFSKGHRVFYAAENRALYGYVYASMNVSSRVRCGRECIMDRRCMSFNFKENTKICELSDMTSAKCTHLSRAIGSVYFDRNKVTPLLSLSGNSPLADRASCKTLLHAGYTSSGVYSLSRWKLR